jgi:nickel/cobalt transporter (NiCoT) family protein
MSRIDSVDSVLMLGAYGWAFVRPIRKLYYNLTITFVSVVVAFVDGGIEVPGLIGDQLSLEGHFWDSIGALNDNFSNIGFLIVGVFIVSWIGSWAIYRLHGFDRLDADVA